MSQFYCREDELRKLNKRYTGNKFECIIIYGRRRVGKTALINEFCKDKPTIFFSSLNTTEKENLDGYSCAMKSHFRKFGNQMSGSGNHLCKFTLALIYPSHKPHAWICHAQH